VANKLVIEIRHMAAQKAVEAESPAEDRNETVAQERAEGNTQSVGSAPPAPSNARKTSTETKKPPPDANHGAEEPTPAFAKQPLTGFAKAADEAKKHLVKRHTLTKK
jgi:hypothetical protein